MCYCLMSNVLESLLQANCDPNHFGHPPKSPAAEAALRNDEKAVELLVHWTGDLNLQVRGSYLPLLTAMKQQRTTMVQCLLALRADPTVKSYPSTRQRLPAPRWVGLTVQQLTTPGSALAHLIEDAVRNWQTAR